MIIASSLSVTLLLMTWSLFSVYSKLQDKGVDRATELQLTRSLIRQLQSDVDHARAFPSITLERPSEDFAEEPSGDPPALPNGARLFGTATTLQLLLRAAPGQAENDLESGLTEPRPDETPSFFELVEYAWFPRPHRPAATGIASDRDRLDPDDTEREIQFGLTRRVVPWFEWNMTLSADPSRNEPRALGPVKQLTTLSTSGPGQDELRTMERQVEPRIDFVPEVSALQFRYFDGTVWTGHWDSRLEGRLPVALEVAFTLRAEGDEIQTDQHRGDYRPEETFDVAADRGELDIGDKFSRGFDDSGEGLDDLTNVHRFVIFVETAVGLPTPLVP